MVFIFLILFLSLTQGYAQETLKNVAVLNFEYSDGFSKKDALSISKRFEVELSKTEVFTILERNEMDKILNEQGFQQSGACDEDNCSVEIGRLIGVDHLVIGNLSDVGETYSLSVKLIDVETGAVISSHAHDLKGDVDDILTESCSKLAREMAGLEEEQWWRNPWIWSGATTLVGAVFITYFLTQEEPESKTLTESVILN